jgi:hypothetical protein
MVNTTLVWHNIFVGQADSSKRLLGVVINNIVEYTFLFVIHFLDFTMFVDEVGAAVFYDLRSALNVESLSVRIVFGIKVFNDGRHSLSLGGEGETNFVFEGDVLVFEVFYIDIQTIEEFGHGFVSCTLLFGGVASYSVFDVHGVDLLNFFKSRVIPFEFSHQSVFW